MARNIGNTLICSFEYIHFTFTFKGNEIVNERENQLHERKGEKREIEEAEKKRKWESREREKEQKEKKQRKRESKNSRKDERK